MTTACYISGACNRTPHTLDWGKNGLVCYGACNSVAVYDPKIDKVYLTLHKHVKNVTVVRWIRQLNDEPETELISGSIDGTLIVWKKIGENFKPVSVLKDTAAVRIAAARYEKKPDDSTACGSESTIFTGNINGELKIWTRNNNDDVKLSQTIKFGNKLPIEISVSYLQHKNVPILAVAMEDSTIQLISQDLNSDNGFAKIQTLIGHEDWVRCLDFTHDDNGDILLASGSQDNMIRLWRISSEDDTEIINDQDLELKKEKFFVGDKEYRVGLESILISHDGWIYGVNWHPAVFSSGIRHQPMKLLSCSLDKTMILWEPDKLGSGIWLESIRVGDVGGNSLGFYGCKFGPNGNSFLAHGYQGSFHMWNYHEETKNWSPSAATSGHFSEVVDLSWDPKGRFLLTTSFDQTTRAHAPWITDSDEEVWHEIGRPQVHGYDMSCVAMLTPYTFASGAEEKVVRTFSAPTTFVNYLTRLSNADDRPSSTAESASVPALGLTNKAVFEGEISQGESLYVGNSKDLNYEKPPTEEELIQHTLWPELQKLYGHGYEVFSMAAKHDGSLLATACKSSSIEHSAIILWDTKTWKIEDRLISHRMTVTQLEFSPNDEYLLSVSRDRTWSLFSCVNNVCKLTASSSKKDNLHGRIIWCCAWSHDSKYFATGSRDGKIGIWNPLDLKDKELPPVTSLEIKDESITALAFAPMNVTKDCYVLAVGLDNGNIEIYKLVVKDNSITFRKYDTLDSSRAHHLTVKRLSFRPKAKILQLASCGSDNIVKIHDLNSEEISQL